MKIFNSRTKSIQKLDFTIENKINPTNPIGLYMCGPTVYNQAHIGNLRSFLFGDIVFRTLKYNYPDTETLYVMNITDIDDKIIKKVDTTNNQKEPMKALLEITRKYEQIFIDDLTKLRIQLPTFHRVSDNMDKIIEMIEKLLELKFAYRVADGSVYFDTEFHKQNSGVSSVQDYFHINIDDSGYNSTRSCLKSTDVKNKSDFVLWKSHKLDKFDDKNIYWDGGNILCNGRPGWHIECSAISKTHLPNVLIHLGGEDLKFPHHSNEIAQSESFDNTRIFGKYWMHVSYLQLPTKDDDAKDDGNNAKDGVKEGEQAKVEKMSKSLGNVIYLSDLCEKYHPIFVRMYIISKHYQRTFAFSYEELDLFVERVYDIYRTIAKLQNFCKLELDTVKPKSENKSLLSKKIVAEIEKEINNNFRIGMAFEVWEKYATMIRNTKKISKSQSLELIEIFKKIDQIFGIIDWNVFEISDEIQEKMQKRDALRKERKYNEADAMRTEIQKECILDDDGSGYIIFHKLRSTN